MYMVRKRFMYWHIPTTTKVHLSLGKNASYCFIPARLATSVKDPVNYIAERLINILTTPISERKVKLRKI